MLTPGLRKDALLYMNDMLVKEELLSYIFYIMTNDLERGI
jgi:hypothetical protein